MSQRFPDRICSPQAICDFAELFEGGFEVIDDFLSKNVGLWTTVRFCEAFFSKPEDVDAGFVAADTADSDCKC